MKTPSRNQFATSRSLPGRVPLTCEFDIRKFLRFNQLTQFAFDANQFELGARRPPLASRGALPYNISRSEEHTSELQSQSNLVCRLLLEKKKKINTTSLL